MVIITFRENDARIRVVPDPSSPLRRGWPPDYSRPWKAKGLESWLHGVPVRCSVLYNMHHEGSSSGPGKAWGGAFMGFTISWHLRKPPLQGLERRLHGVPVQYSVLYNMHHEGSSPGPGRAWGVAFIAFFCERYV